MWTVSSLRDSNPEPNGAPGAVSSFSPLLWVSRQGSGRSWLLLESVLCYPGKLWLSRPGGPVGRALRGLVCGVAHACGRVLPTTIEQEGLKWLRPGCSPDFSFGRKQARPSLLLGCFSSLKPLDLAETWRSRTWLPYPPNPPPPARTQQCGVWS